MKYLRKFDSVSDMETALASSAIGIIGLAYDNGQPVVNAKPTPPDPRILPFYINVRGAVTLAATSGLQMSTDGETWTDTTATTLPTGKTYFRVATDKTSPLKPNWTEDENSDYDIGGNINSLVKVNFENNTNIFHFSDFFTYKQNLKNAGDLILPATTLANYCYSYMFEGCESLVTAPALPATTLAEGCYEGMFTECTSLTTAPALPATTLAESCYSTMFYYCSSLTTAPVLPATTLADYCYSAMFYGCTSLTSAPALPATTLAYRCYGRMFNACTALTSAPALPATTLTYGCYYNMFYGCTSLATAPELPAITLTEECYSYMFNDCTNLNYIKCLATDISASGCTDGWVDNVASSGTFVKDSSMESWTIGVNGIPTNWVVKNSTGVYLTQALNVASIEVNNLDTGTGYYTINGGSQVSLSEGTTIIAITEAMNGQTLLAYGEFGGEAVQETLTLSWVDYTPSVTITESDNYVTITSATANNITYRLGSSGEYSTYTEPVYIAEDTTIYVIATRTVSGVVYTANTSQEVTHTVLPPANLVISCSSNKVTITADYATTIEYNTDGSSTYITYTEPFAITETVTVYAKASNVDGNITASQECEYIDYTIPFYIEDVSGSSNTVQISKNNSNAPTLTIEKSSDGENWETMGSTSTTAITATVPANGKLYLRCSTNTWGNSYGYYNYIDPTGNCNVGGNINSLLYGSNFTGNERTFPSGSTSNFYRLFGYTHIVSAAGLLLPATTLTANCYQYMFTYCTALTSAPVLPATTLAESCYGAMFQGCTALRAAPTTLPATTLADWCYQNMFSGCTSLTSAPALPATTLATNCYRNMFSGCTALTSAPALPATTLVQECYYSMFSGCTHLTSALVLPATTLAESCYQYMFNGCTALTSAPVLPATTLANNCYQYMFQGCTSLTSAPVLPATTLTRACYYYMFSGCTALTSAPVLPATTLTNNCYQYMFSGCTALTSAPVLPATSLATSCYSYMFSGCTHLTSAPVLPATTLANNCYQYMFNGCTSLTSAPVLPATTLAQSCYGYMFQGCTSLNYIKCLATNISATNCTSNWVYNVASSGTFVKDQSMSSWTTGAQGIPEGWTVQDAQD